MSYLWVLWPAMAIAAWFIARWLERRMR